MTGIRISNRDDGLTHRMPAHFRQWPPSGGGVCPYDDCTTLEISYLTDEQKLRQYVPKEFSITRPLVMVMYEKCSGVQWMGGSQYSLVTVSVPVQYVAGKEPIDGIYHLVLWEDKCEPSSAGARRQGCPRSSPTSPSTAGSATTSR